MGWTTRVQFPAVEMMGLFLHHRVQPDSEAHPAFFLSDGYRELFTPEVKRPGREADHTPPPTADVKNALS